MHFAPQRSAADNPLRSLIAAHRPTAERFAPEDSPFTTVIVDITHRCNMECRNCYIPVRDLPDLPVDWLYGAIGRFPRRTRIRLAGAEPTTREDLPEIIRRVRAMGHLPVVLTNGLKLGRPSYVDALRAAGLRTVHLSMNGGLRDDLYEAIDGMPCAARKLKALENLQERRFYTTVGMILAPGVNDGHLPEFLRHLLERGVRDVHLRSVGAMGRHMEGEPFTLDGLEGLLRSALPPTAPQQPEPVGQTPSSRDFRVGRALIQITAWPDLGSRTRGRLTPDGFVEPFFENALANQFRY